MKILKNDWAPLLESEFSKDYYIKLREYLKCEYKTHTIYPNMYDIFNALHYTPYAKTKVCIIGQDPYHGEGQAHGLSFSVKPDVKIPPSLLNIYKELESDLGYPIPDNGYLKSWTEEGVLLLNAVLTVRACQAASHRGIGWEIFTDNIIANLNLHKTPIVFILWGAFAISKKPMITNKAHFIITSPHPSPLSASRGFLGSKPFSKTNAFLESIGETPVNWQIKNNIK